MPASKKPPLLDRWDVCFDAVSVMDGILDKLEDYSGTYEEVTAMRKQLKRIKGACSAGVYESPDRDDAAEDDWASTWDNDPRTAARRLIDHIPLRKIFRDKDLADVFLSELFIAIAKESGRENRKNLQRKGIEEAKAQGVRFGKPTRPLPENFEEMRKAWRDGKYSMSEAAKLCGLPESTFYNAVKRTERAAQKAGCIDEREAERGAGKTKDLRGRTADPVRHHQGPTLPHAGTGGSV